MPNPLRSLYTSRKTLRVGLGIVTVLSTLYFVLPTLTTPEAKSYAVMTAILSIAGLLGVDINAIKAEDVATKSAPTSQVNVGSDVHNPPAPPTDDPPPQPAPVKRPSPFPTQPVWTSSETTEHYGPTNAATLAPVGWQGSNTANIP